MVRIMNEPKSWLFPEAHKRKTNSSLTAYDTQRQIIEGSFSFDWFFLLLQALISLTISLIFHSSKYSPIYRGCLHWLNNGLTTLVECIKKRLCLGENRMLGNFQALKMESYFENEPFVTIYFENWQYKVHPGIARLGSCSNKSLRYLSQ